MEVTDCLSVISVINQFLTLISDSQVFIDKEYLDKHLKDHSLTMPKQTEITALFNCKAITILLFPPIQMTVTS